jgi:hypothetical protein
MKCCEYRPRSQKTISTKSLKTIFESLISFKRKKKYEAEKKNFVKKTWLQFDSNLGPKSLGVLVQ